LERRLLLVGSMRVSAQSVMTAAGATMIAAALFLALHYRKVHHSRVTPTASTQVRLMVEHRGDGLRLRWNPEAPEIQRAAYGVISIDDGGHHSRLPLDAAQLRTGMAAYRPQERQVTFRLELGGGPAGEIRVWADPRPSPFGGGPKPAVRAASLPLQPPEEADRDEEPRATLTHHLITPPAAPAPVRERVVKAPPAPVTTPSAERSAPSAPAAVHEPPAAPARTKLARAEEPEDAQETAEPESKSSRLGRVVRKIPLLRRLHRDKDKDKDQ
jgi:hypothetical protein